MDTIFNKNILEICGTIISDFKYEYSIKDTRLYKAYIEVERLSKAKDVLPVIIKEENFIRKESYLGKTVCIKGSIRSYNTTDEMGKHLKIHIYAEECIIEDGLQHNNYLNLEGYICRKPLYRTTGANRVITELLLACNRPVHNTDYIPCICWGDVARATADLEIGTKCEISGRFQSREYLKKVDGVKEKRIAFEVSVYKFEQLEEQ